LGKSLFIKKSSVQGRGVFAKNDFNQGQIILEIDDSHVVLDPSKLTRKQNEYDCDYLACGKVILMQPPEKYINHSCTPNSYIKTVKGTRRVLAMRSIKKGEEITFDYSINGYNDGFFKCSCKSKNCRKYYQGNFFKLPTELQIKYSPYLDDWFVEEHKKEIAKIYF